MKNIIKLIFVFLCIISSVITFADNLPLLSSNRYVVESDSSKMLAETKEQCLKRVAECQRECAQVYGEGSDKWMACRTNCGNAGSCEDN